MFDVVQDECTNYSCPIMSAGEQYCSAVVCNIIVSNSSGKIKTSTKDQLGFRQSCILKIL